MEPPVKLGVLEGVPMVVEVELGRRAITLGDLMKLKTGVVISLPRPAGGPLDLYIGGSPIGRAEVIPHGRKRGIQIIEVGHV